MKAIISCRTLENELCQVMQERDCAWPVFWLESGLHNVPTNLNEKIQALLDSFSDYDTVLLATGFCGNSVIGLHTGGFRLVVPRCDDCISLLMGSVKRRQAAFATYFLTEGWLKGENNIWVEYDYCLRKYGEKRGKRIFSAILANYKYLAMLDTGCFEAAPLEHRMRQMADAMGLEYIRLEGTLSYLTELLSGTWPEERFLVLQPYSTLTSDLCTL